jgi:hypothetical protein
MDEALIIKQLEETIGNLRKIRLDTWGKAIRTLPIDREIKSLEDVIGQIAYKDKWNGVHPMGVS